MSSILQASGGRPKVTALVSGDIPNNAANTTGTSSNITGVAAIANGGTNSSSALANNKVMQSSGGAIVESAFFNLATAHTTYFTFASVASYPESSSTLQRGIGFDTGATVTVPSTKELDAIRWDQDFIVSATATASLSNHNLSSNSGSDSTSNLYGHLGVVTNNGPGTVKGMYSRAIQGSGSAGVAMAMVAGVNTFSGAGTSAGIQLSHDTFTNGGTLTYGVYQTSNVVGQNAALGYGFLLDGTISISNAGFQMSAVGAGNFLQLKNSAGSADLFIVNNTGNITMDHQISMNGETTGSNLTVGRRTTNNATGRTLTVQAGAAKSGATDTGGGSLTLSAGISTGTGGSSISFQTATPGSTGTSDNTPSTKFSIGANGDITQNADSATTAYLGNYYGNGRGRLTHRTSNGTLAAPTKIAANDVMFQIEVRGYHEDGTPGFLGTNATNITTTATQDFTATASGAKLTFSTTPNGSTTNTLALTLGQDQSAVFTGAISASNLSGTNTGDVTLSAFGSTPNANGASLSGQALTLQPADATNPGGVSTGTQTFAGAKTFSSTITGTTSGNTTYTANNHGVVISSATNAMSVIAPDASTTKVLKSGGTGADPTWLAYDNANTASTLVFRDSSNNFSAGTITAALSGNATTATTATNATNVATTATNATNASFFPTFVASSSSSNQGIDTATGLSFNPSTNTLTTTTFSGALSGNATTATTATNATNTAITDDTTTNATVYPTWVTTTTGNLPQKVSSTKLTFNPSTGALTTSGTFSASNVSGSTSGTNTGDVTLSAFGSSPNANGASLSGQALTLQPADGTNPGGVSTASQTFGGTKTFSAIVISGDLTVDTNTFYVDSTNNRIGILTTTPSNALSFGPGATRVIRIEESTTGAGNAITLRGGSALTGGTDLGGGNVTIIAGNSTGTGGASVVFQTPTPSATGTTNNAPSTKLTISELGGFTHISEGATTAYQMDAYAGGKNMFLLRSANGTKGTPTKITSGNTMVAFNARGYQETTSAFLGTNSASIAVVATEDFTSTAGGTKITFSTTPNTTTTLTTALTLDQDQSGTFASWAAATNHVQGFRSTTTATGTTTLTKTDTYYQAFTGTNTQNCDMPVVTTLQNGWTFRITNTSTGTVTVRSSGANTIKAMAQNSMLDVWVINTGGGTGTASWNWQYTATLNN